MSGLGDIVELYAETDEERNLIHHVRGNAHLSTACPLCKALREAYAHSLRIDTLVNGTPLPEWVDKQHPAPLPKPSTAKSSWPPKISLDKALDAFHAATGEPRVGWTRDQGRNNGNRIRTVKWIRDHDEIPSADEIKHYYEVLEA